MNALSSRGFASRIFLATAALAAGSTVLLAAGCATAKASGGNQPLTSAAPVISSASPSPSPSPALPTHSIAGLPGWLYYQDANARVLRLTESGLDTVVSNDSWSGNVSPDGASIAYIDQNNNIVVTDRDGQHPRTVMSGSSGPGFEPVWSPDSQRLLTAKTGASRVFGIITVASATFTPLPHQLQDAIHPLWSADGQHLGYATGTCKLGTADADGGNAHLVPVFGDMNSPANPQQRRSCTPYSISPDGTLIAVFQHTGDQPDGDISRALIANTIIDTRTGNNVTLPVTGQIIAIRFQPNGDILVRTTTGGTNQLTLLNHDHTIKTQVTEPATVNNASLLAYTPN